MASPFVVGCHELFVSDRADRLIPPQFMLSEMRGDH